MAGENNFNANKMAVTVFDGDGKEYKMSRPNAREMVQSGDYFWKTDDIGADRTEAEGPADPTAETMAVHNVETGEILEVARANARDMVATGNYTWAPAHADTASEETDEDTSDDDKSDDKSETGEETVNAATDEVVTTEPTADDPLDPANSPLHEIAARVTGDVDVKAYLNGFTEDNLREMSAQRYPGEKVHHRASKDTIIEKMMAFEEAKLDSADAGDSDEG